MYFKREWVSAAVLKPPVVKSGKLHKGALILNQIDPLVQIFPELLSLFTLIERRGWFGMNDNHHADIKLVEDPSTLEATRHKFPNAVLLELGPADFIDTDSFRPLRQACQFDVIQVACWSKRKRIELLIEAAGLLPDISFLQLGHFENKGTLEEIAVRDYCIDRAAQVGANVAFPYANANGNASLPTAKDAMNKWINCARVGVLTTSSEGINRFKMECLAAGRPMIVCNDVAMPTRKHINSRTGLLVDPSPLAIASAIRSILNAEFAFEPREYVVEHTGKSRSLFALKRALREVCLAKNLLYHFDDIDWDGRNESMTWGDSAIDVLRRTIHTYHT